MRGAYRAGADGGPASEQPLMRYEAAVRVPIAVGFSRACGKCGTLTNNRPSMAQDGLPPVLCVACCVKYVTIPMRRILAKRARCKAKEGMV